MAKILILDGDITGQLRHFTLLSPLARALYHIIIVLIITVSCVHVRVSEREKVGLFYEPLFARRQPNGPFLFISSAYHHHRQEPTTLSFVFLFSLSNLILLHPIVLLVYTAEWKFLLVLQRLHRFCNSTSDHRTTQILYASQEKLSSS